MSEYNVTKVSMIMVPLIEHENMKSENIRMRAQILQLSQDKETLEEMKVFHEQTIDELKKENEMLKEKIKELTTEVKELKTEIKDLKNFKQEYNTDKLFKKLIVAIQDCNDKYELEKQFVEKGESIDTINDLRYLHQDRLDFAHYIKDNFDTEEIIEYKVSLLVKHLKYLPEDVASKFRRKYGNVIEKMVKYIPVNDKAVLSRRQKERVEDYWTD